MRRNVDQGGPLLRVDDLPKLDHPGEQLSLVHLRRIFLDLLGLPCGRGAEAAAVEDRFAGLLILRGTVSSSITRSSKATALVRV